ncbi:hypothetical protein [Rhizobium sp. S163]|uniref:hypothetical protein n=1 Tax=Rhizobium sp. S163 TaxID=3055039 RepID=UPI0025A94425|nr:hypothetical protein [Rhizobium sp. S163]MDM9646824.1 hypothetical protein [Rhizobium sp. S163]
MSGHTPIPQRMHDWPRKKRSFDAVEEQAHAAVVEHSSKTVVDDEAYDDALESGRRGAKRANDTPGE